MTPPLTNIGPGNILCMLSVQEIGWAANFGFRVWWQQNFWSVQTLPVSSFIMQTRQKRHVGRQHQSYSKSNF